jgi:hypothetical protein
VGFTTRHPAIAATATEPTFNDPYDHNDHYNPYDHLAAIHDFLPTIDDKTRCSTPDELERLEHIIAVDALQISDKSGSVYPADHRGIAFYQLRCLVPLAHPDSPFVRAVKLGEEMKVRPRFSPVHLPSIKSEQAARAAALAEKELERAEAYAVCHAPAFRKWRYKLRKANGGIPPAPLRTLMVKFMRDTPIDELVTHVSVTLHKKPRHPGVFFACFSNEPGKTYAVSLAHTRGRTPLIAKVTGWCKAKVSKRHFAVPLMASFMDDGLSKTEAMKKARKEALEQAMRLFHSLGNLGSDPYKSSEVCVTALVNGVETCASAAVGRTALWAHTEEGELFWGPSGPPSQNARDPASMTADDHRRIELVRKHVKEQNEAAARAAAAEREAASAPVHVPAVAVAPEPEPKPPVTPDRVAQALIRLREVVRRHTDYFQAKAGNLGYDSGHKMCKAMGDINSDSQDKWIAAATYLGSILLLDRTPSGRNRHGVITTTPEEQEMIKFICSLTPCFRHFRGTIDQSQRDDEGNCIPAFKPGVTLENCDTPRCHFSNGQSGTRCPFQHTLAELLGPNGRIELGKDNAWFCYNRGMRVLRNKLQKGEECLGLRPSDVGPGISVTDHDLRRAVRAETDAQRTLADFLVPERVQRPDRRARRKRSSATDPELMSAEDAAAVRAVAMRAEESEDDSLLEVWKAECEELGEAGKPIPSYDEWLNSSSLRSYTTQLLEAPRFTVGTHERPASKGGRGNRGSKAHLGTVNGFSAKPTRRRNGAYVKRR